MFHAFVLTWSVLQGGAFIILLRAMAPARFRTARARALQWAWTALAMVGIIAIETLGRNLAPLDSPWWRLLLGTERVLGVAALFTALVIVPTDAVSRVIARIGRRTPPPETPPVGITRREAIVQAAALGVAGTNLTAAFIGNLHRLDSLEVTDMTLVIPDLPPSMEGFTFIQLTDLHIGMFTGRRELDHLVETVRRLRTDAIVLTGDVMDHSPRHIPLGMQSLGRLHAPRGVYGILGNHDHVTGASQVARGMSAVGIRPLVNASLRFAPGGGDPLILAGVDDLMARRMRDGGGPDLDLALQGTPRGAPVLLLAHNPLYFDEVAGRVAAQLSGHTHGGQINVGGMAHMVMPYVAGRYERLGSQLYVCRGIGITGPPVRLGAAPEVTRIGLTARRA